MGCCARIHEDQALAEEGGALLRRWARRAMSRRGVRARRGSATVDKLGLCSPPRSGDKMRKTLLQIAHGCVVSLQPPV